MGEVWRWVAPCELPTPGPVCRSSACHTSCCQSTALFDTSARGCWGSDVELWGRCLCRTFAQLVVAELLERFPPELTGIAGSAHMQAAAAYLGGSAELALCRRTVGSAMPAFDLDAATSPVGVFCTVRSCRRNPGETPVLHMQLRRPRRG